MVCNTPRRNLKYISYIFVLCWAWPLGTTVYHSLTIYKKYVILKFQHELWIQCLYHIPQVEFIINK